MGLMGLVAVMWIAQAGQPGVPPRALEERSERAQAAREREPGPVPAWVDVRNTMEKQFRLVEAHLELDGQVIARRVAAEGESLGERFRLFDGQLEPGEHNLTAVLVYEGRNRGPFTYLDNYTYRVTNDLLFALPEGEGVAGVEVVSRAQGGPTVPRDDQPTLTFVPPAGSAIAPVVPRPRAEPAAR